MSNEHEVLSTSLELSVLAEDTGRPMETNAEPQTAELQTAEQPIEATAEQPIEATAEQPIEATAEQPIEATAEQPIEATAEQPIEATAEQPIEATAEQPLETTAEQPIEATADSQTSEQPTEATADPQTSEQPIEAPAERQTSEQPIEATAEPQTSEQPIEATAEQPIEATTEPKKQRIERRIAVLGCLAVGKSSLVLQYIDDQFVDSYDPTIENIFLKNVTVNGQEYHMQLIDTVENSHNGFRVHGYLLVYSLSSRQSFEAIKGVRDQLVHLTDRPLLPIVLVANKLDLVFERVVTKEEGQDLATEWNAVYHEVTAKDNWNVKNVFHSLLVEIEKYDGDLMPFNRHAIM